MQNLQRSKMNSQLSFTCQLRTRAHCDSGALSIMSDCNIKVLNRFRLLALFFIFYYSSIYFFLYLPSPALSYSFVNNSFSFIIILARYVSFFAPFTNQQILSLILLSEEGDKLHALQVEKFFFKRMKKI